MAHTSNKIPMTLILPDGNERPVRCYQVPSAGERVTLDGNPFQVLNVNYHFPSARIYVTLGAPDSGCSLCEIRDVVDEILIEVKSDIL